jgi:hypothetical protein
LPRKIFPGPGHLLHAWPVRPAGKAIDEERAKWNE